MPQRWTNRLIRWMGKDRMDGSWADRAHARTQCQTAHCRPSVLVNNLTNADAQTSLGNAIVSLLVDPPYQSGNSCYQSLGRISLAPRLMFGGESFASAWDRDGASER